MSPLLVSLLSLLVSSIKPADVVALVAELVKVVDPLIASKGFVIRAAWGVIRGLLTSGSVVKDIESLLSQVKDNHPEVATAAANWNV